MVLGFMVSCSGVFFDLYTTGRGEFPTQYSCKLRLILRRGMGGGLDIRHTTLVLFLGVVSWLGAVTGLILGWDVDVQSPDNFGM